MSTTRSLALLAVWCLIGGCSKSPVDSHQASQEPRLLSTVQTSAASTQVASLASRTNIVQTGLLEPSENPPQSVASEPVLRSEPTAYPNAAADHDEATHVLREAAKVWRTQLTVIGNNLANANTVAFKRDRVALETCGYRQIKLPGAQDAFTNYAPTSIAVGHGCRIQGIETDFGQGPIEQTGRPLDVAIEGEGFFQVIDPDTNNFLYTRAGNFALNSNGLLVIGSSSTGRLVQPQISIPVDTIGVIISAEGNVSIQQFGQTQYSQIGQLQLAKFLNPQGLLKLGENLYQETLASGAAIFGTPGTNGLGRLRQQALERSNVDVDDELMAWQAAERKLHACERLVSGAVSGPAGALVHEARSRSDR